MQSLTICSQHNRFIHKHYSIQSQISIFDSTPCMLYISEQFQTIPHNKLENSFSVQMICKCIIIHIIISSRSTRCILIAFKLLIASLIQFFRYNWCNKVFVSFFNWYFLGLYHYPCYFSTAYCKHRLIWLHYYP